MSTSLCDDTIALILSYGDLSVLAVGLYIDRSFNKASNKLLDIYLTRVNLKKDDIKVICCQDDSVPIVAVNQMRIEISSMAHFVEDIDGMEYSYIIYDNRVSLLVNYTLGNAAYIMCPTKNMVFHRKSIVEVIDLNDMPDYVTSCIHNETLYVANTTYTAYAFRLGGSSTYRDSTLSRGTKSKVIKHSNIRVPVPYIIDPVRKKYIVGSPTMRRFTVVDRPKKLLHN